MTMALLQRVHHVGIAVADLETASTQYESLFGFRRGLQRELPQRGVSVVFFESPGAKIELLAPLGAESTVARFLAKQGPGLHHLCYEVGDIRQALSELQAAGLEAIDREPREGAEGKLVAFLHPRTAGGVLIELQQK